MQKIFKIGLQVIMIFTAINDKKWQFDESCWNINQRKYSTDNALPWPRFFWKVAGFDSLHCWMMWRASIFDVLCGHGWCWLRASCAPGGCFVISILSLWLVCLWKRVYSVVLRGGIEGNVRCRESRKRPGASKKRRSKHTGLTFTMSR